MGQCFGLHLQINFSINVGSIKRHVPQPGTDCVNIDARAEEVDCRCVSNGMGADFFFWSDATRWPALLALRLTKVLIPKRVIG